MSMNTHLKHQLGTPIGSTSWEHRLEAPAGNLHSYEATYGETCTRAPLGDGEREPAVDLRDTTQAQGGTRH